MTDGCAQLDVSEGAVPGPGGTDLASRVSRVAPPLSRLAHRPAQLELHRIVRGRRWRLGAPIHTEPCAERYMSS